MELKSIGCDIDVFVKETADIPLLIQHRSSQYNYSVDLLTEIEVVIKQLSTDLGVYPSRIVLRAGS